MRVGITNGLNNHSDDVMEYVDFNDLYNSFKINWQVSSTFEISFTMTYTDQYKDVFNLAQMKRYIWFNRNLYTIQQLTKGLDENGLPTLQITANHALIDQMKNIRLDPKEPTVDNPDVSGSGDSGDDSGDSGDDSDDDSDNQQPGTTVTVKQTDVQQAYKLEDQLHKFIDNNNAGVKLDIKGSFPQMPAEATGSLFEWLGSNIASYGAFWYPSGQATLVVRDLPSFQNRTDNVFRYLNNMTTANLQSDGNDLVNDCWVYGGKVEKDITSVSAGGNGVSEPVNGDWTPVIKNAAGLVGEKLSQADIDLIKAQINLESSGREDAKGGDDGLSDGIAMGLLQFKQGTFNYYCRPPYTNIWHGLDQLIALMNVPNWRNQITGRHGWSPSGAPVSKATITAQPATDNSWGWPFPCGEGTFSGGQLFGVQPGGGFRINGFHDGLDFGSIDHPGNEVHAIHGGKVTTAATWGGSEIKWYLVITDSTGLNVEYQEAFGSQNNITVGYGQEVHTGDVIGYRTTDHLHVGITRMNVQQAFGHAFSNDGTWLDPKAMIESGGSISPSGDSGSTSTSTTTESYYSLYYHYIDKDSQDKYGVHVGPPIVQDSIYDMNTLKTYVANTVKHDPPTSLTTAADSWKDVQLGDQIRVIAPEMPLDTWAMLMGISGNPFNENEAPELTYNNTGEAMKSFIAAVTQEFREINRNSTTQDTRGVSIGTKQENHFANPNTKPKTYTAEQMAKIADYTNGEDVTW